MSQPNDEEEQDRMDLLHHVFLLILGGELFVSPIERNGLQRVLDLGTGTGIWAIDFAECAPLPVLFASRFLLIANA